MIQRRRFNPLLAAAAILLSSVTPACARREPAPDEHPGDSKSAAGKQPTVDESTGWPRPRSVERSRERRTMVQRQIVARGVRDAVVLDAMKSVPRHWFVPHWLQRSAYTDRPLSIGEGQTISQPYIVALMTEALSLTRASKVLEIGTGSGYQAAVLSEITPHVFTIEIVERLGRRAIECFKERGYATIKTRIGDGYAGWPEHAPFDVVIVTCAPDHIPPKLIEQLKPGGRICIPVGDERRVQSLRLVTKTDDGKLKTTDLLPVRFVPMTGDALKKSRED